MKYFVQALLELLHIRMLLETEFENNALTSILLFRRRPTSITTKLLSRQAVVTAEPM